MEPDHEEKAGVQESARSGAWQIGQIGQLGPQRGQTASQPRKRAQGRLVKSRKKTIAVRRNARRPRPGRRKKS